MKVYENREAARRAAVEHFVSNKSTAILAYPLLIGVPREIAPAGELPAIVVVDSGEILDRTPFGESWTEFVYEP